MKIRYVFVAIALAASAACQSSPTASRAEDSHSAAGFEARLDGITPPPDTTTSRSTSGGGGALGSGN